MERVNSRLELVGLDCLKFRGLRKTVVHVLLCMITMLLVAVAAIMLGRLDHLLHSGGERIDLNMQFRWHVGFLLLSNRLNHTIG